MSSHTEITRGLLVAQHLARARVHAVLGERRWRVRLRCGKPCLTWQARQRCLVGFQTDEQPRSHGLRGFGQRLKQTVLVRSGGQRYSPLTMRRRILIVGAAVALRVHPLDTGQRPAP
jgi:hypothetical protein